MRQHDKLYLMFCCAVRVQEVVGSITDSVQPKYFQMFLTIYPAFSSTCNEFMVDNDIKISRYGMLLRQL